MNSTEMKLGPYDVKLVWAKDFPDDQVLICAGPPCGFFFEGNKLVITNRGKQWIKKYCVLLKNLQQPNQ